MIIKKASKQTGLRNNIGRGRFGPNKKTRRLDPDDPRINRVGDQTGTTSPSPVASHTNTKLASPVVDHKQIDPERQKVQSKANQKQEEIVASAITKQMITAKDLALLLALNIDNSQLKARLLEEELALINLDEYPSRLESSTKKRDEKTQRAIHKVIATKMLIARLLQAEDTSMTINSASINVSELVPQLSEDSKLSSKELKDKIKELKLALELHTKPLHQTHIAVQTSIQECLFETKNPRSKQEQALIILELAKHMPALKTN